MHATKTGTVRQRLAKPSTTACHETAHFYVSLPLNICKTSTTLLYFFFFPLPQIIK